MKKALITGISGQDGSYLAELLLNKGYEVHGLLKRNSNYELHTINHIKDKVFLHYGDLTPDGHLPYIINELKPDELYNLAAQSDVRVSFDIPEYTSEVTGLGVLRILEAVRRFSSNTKIYQASSSELFGATPPLQNETSKMKPNNPYAVSKLYAHEMCRVYRESYNLFISCGILFNHESPRRGLNFVTRKICNNVAKIYRKEIDKFELGNLDAKRDWGYAKEYVEAMWKMLQIDSPEDFVVATGEQHSIKEFLNLTFNYLGLKDWKQHIIINNRLKRPLETQSLCGDISKAKKILNWEPKVKFKDLVKIMIEAELVGIE